MDDREKPSRYIGRHERRGAASPETL